MVDNRTIITPEQREQLLLLSLIKLSPYIETLKPLAPKLVDILRSNLQLQPIWNRLLELDLADKNPINFLSVSEKYILRNFFEYIYFASDAFAHEVFLEAQTGICRFLKPREKHVN